MEYARRSRGLAVEFAVLGFLIDSPMHGYELRDRVARGLGSFWRIATSQLYLVLRRLEEEGWVDCVVESGSAGPSRNVYRIADRGERAFWDWATSSVLHVRQIRVEFLAKVYFLRRLAPERLAQLLAAQRQTLRELSDHLARRSRLDTDDEVIGALAASYRRRQVSNTLRWLEESEQLLLSGRENE